jgi:SAM-dependent methyltransferase
MERIIEPEWLDDLPSHEPLAIGSRRDLRVLNGFMGNASIVADALRPFPIPKRVLDLGSGDGSFALRLARDLRWRGVEFILLDRHGVSEARLHRKFGEAHCSMAMLRRDVLAGFDEVGAVDIACANLFLHHFAESELRWLLAEVAAKCRVFIACEPRRSSFALCASRLVGALGCNAVTRHDAVISVRAGFRGRELSQLWAAENWSCHERAAGVFSHLFVAHRL